MSKYKHQPTRKQIKDLRIEVVKDKKGKIKGFTVWTGDFWVLDGSVMKDRDEVACRVYTGNKNRPIQFEYFEKGNVCGNFLELRSKDKPLKQ